MLCAQAIVMCVNIVLELKDEEIRTPRKVVVLLFGGLFFIHYAIWHICFPNTTVADVAEELFSGYAVLTWGCVFPLVAMAGTWIASFPRRPAPERLTHQALLYVVMEVLVSLLRVSTSDVHAHQCVFLCKTLSRVRVSDF